MQQHGDVIAVDYEARAAGLIKHMDPAAARDKLKKHGVGRVVHAFEEHGRVSYTKYLAASSEIHKALTATSQRLSSAAVCEKVLNNHFSKQSI